jgi:patatin-like phospholipase/acyl hydrolase
MKTLLAIDGGGLFGVGVANWVPRLKWKFDYYAGTSVGSILAACLKEFSPSLDFLRA